MKRLRSISKAAESEPFIAWSVIQYHQVYLFGGGLIWQL